MNRPAEIIQAGIGTVAGAVFIILASYGVSIPPEVPAAAIVIVSFVAALVTAIVSRSE